MNPLANYFQLMTMKGAIEVYETARDTGLLQALQQDKTIDQLVTEHALDRRALKATLPVLESFGLVESSGADCFRSTPLVHFLQGDYRDLGASYWNHLPTFLETGDPVMAMDQPSPDDNAYVAKVDALGAMMTPSAQWLAEHLEIDSDSDRGTPLAILDLGAGSGVWGLNALAKQPGAELTLLDRAEVLRPLRQRLAKDERDGNKAIFLEGDVFEKDLGTCRYDRILVANFAHLFPADTCTELWRKLHRSLRPGGQLVVIDVLQTTPTAALYALGLALRTRHGEVHTAGALEQQLKSGGFGRTKVVSIPVTPGVMGAVIGSRDV